MLYFDLLSCDLAPSTKGRLLSCCSILIDPREFTDLAMRRVILVCAHTRNALSTFRTASGSSGQRRRGKKLRGELTEHEFVMQIVAGVASRRVSAPLRISEHLVTATSIRPFSHRNVNSSFRMR
jgi:hypothetical protein